MAAVDLGLPIGVRTSFEDLLAQVVEADELP